MLFMQSEAFPHGHLPKGRMISAFDHTCAKLLFSLLSRSHFTRTLTLHFNPRQFQSKEVYFFQPPDIPDFD